MINKINKLVGFFLKRLYLLFLSILLVLSISPLMGSASAENWHLYKAGTNHQIEGYVSKPSYIPGSIIDFHVSCDSGTFNAAIYRMGWYDGSGAKLLANPVGLACKKQIIPPASNQTGLINPDWQTTFKFQTPGAWEPGIYLTKLTGADGYQNYVPFILRASKPSSPYLIVHSINTDAAYNAWGGDSLYSGYTPDLKIDRAVKVSLNRPFAEKGGPNDGSGFFLRWEYPMIKFLEKYGYKVDYLTDVDVHEHPNWLLHYKCIIIAGHDEYWSKQMMDGYTAAVAHGVNLAVFAANTAFRPVRFEPDPSTGQPDRIMVDYKNSRLDPMRKINLSLVTPYNWRNPPLSEPESKLLGLAYVGEVQEAGTQNSQSGDLVVDNARCWIFNGTGLKMNDRIKRLVGYEYDTLYNNLPHPSDIDLVFKSKVTNSFYATEVAESGFYKLPKGGQVFDAGTIEWSWGLDPSNKAYSPQLVRITENILNRFGST